jgi:hypothetical protein
LERDFITGMISLEARLKAALSLACALIVLLFSGPGDRFDKLWSSSTAHREQVEALLQGRLSLCSTPARLLHDYAWAGGGVQQVWGLGIPLWRLPWELFGRAIGLTPFPDRLALVGFASVAIFSLLTGLWNALRKETDPLSRLLALMAAGVMSFNPVFVRLATVRMDVYEEALVYTFLCELLLLGRLLALAANPSLFSWFAICFIAGFGAFIRPTVGVCGLAAVASATVWGRTRQTVPHWARWRPLAAGWTMLGAELTALGLTNSLRFGAFAEFGHSLNVQGKTLLGSVYATRFYNPFADAPFIDQLCELLAALFLPVTLTGGNWFALNAIAGQSRYGRWREFYFDTYDISWLLIIFAGWSCLRWLLPRKEMTNANSSLNTAAVLALWSLLSSVGLAALYIRTPAISSRYLTDFAAPFGAALAAALVAFGHPRNRRRWQRASLLIVPIWMAAEYERTNTVYGPSRGFTAAAVAESTVRQREREALPVPSLGYHYTRETDFQSLHIPYNGEGWDKKSGLVASIVILFAENINMVNIDISETPVMSADQTPDFWRVKIGLEELKCRHRTKRPGGWLLTFDGPVDKRYQTGIQPLFIATTGPDHFSDRVIPWRMESVQWRKPADGMPAKAGIN